MTINSNDAADSHRSKVQPLARGSLYCPCDPNDLLFQSTSELEDLKEMVGQDRAVNAVKFAIGMKLPGFNVFVLGPPGTGRHSFIRRYLSHKASHEFPASDWCYVNDFDNPRQPIALELPAGRGRQLVADIEQLIEEASTCIPKAFDSEDYQARKQAIEDEFGKEQAQRLQEIQKQAEQRRLAVVQTPVGFAFTPLREGKAISAKEIKKLPEEEQKRLQEETSRLSEELKQAMEDIPKLVRKTREKINQLDNEIAMLSTGSLIGVLLERYAEIPKVVDYLKAVKEDMIANVDLFLPEPDPSPLKFSLPSKSDSDQSTEQRYSVNLLVGHHDTEGAPVVIEDNPTHQNLIGEVEYEAQMGALVTNFSLIKSGALHRANGGYLVLDAYKILSFPLAWEALKMALSTRQVRIQSLSQAYQSTSTVTLDPEPIPLDVKVLLVGDRWLYYRLQALDPEFLELFKVAADFDDRIDRSPESHQLFARLLGTLSRQENLKPMNREAVARLIEESARHAGHSKKLSAQVGRVADIMREANYWTSQESKDLVRGEDIQRAIDSRIHRASRLRERLLEEIMENTILIDTEKEHVGQVNGLAVMEVGDFSFAHPNRITARVSIGSGKVVDIEREAKLGGPIHSKGVLILSGFLAAHYVPDQPLSLAASLVLEQSYGGVEGDSASSTELYALLSALAQIPIKQCYAVTGSVNQHGEVQAIGGVNQKIEGFYEICQARGLKGNQGVLIPESNVKHLMLRRPVIEAVETGRFNIFPVRTIDEGIELLTGLPAGQRDAKGNYPKGTFNYCVRKRLLEFAEKRRRFGIEGEQEESDSE